MSGREMNAPTYVKAVLTLPIRYVLKITLETGVILLYDDDAGCGHGDDGRDYYPVCRSSSDDLEILGWSAALTQEMLL